MSISKTVFRNDSLALQQSEIKTWLETYAMDYFDSITEDTTPYNCIVCKIGDTTALKLYFDGTNAYDAYLNNGSTINGYRSDNSAKFIEGVATSKALCLSYENNNIQVGNIGHINNLVITKDINDDVVFIYLGATRGGSYHYFATGFFENYNWDYWASGSASSIYGGGTILGSSASLTSLVPIPDKTYTKYTNNAYIEIFNQYFGQKGQFTIDGINYYTNGYIALKD